MENWVEKRHRSYDTSNEYYVYGFGAKIPPSHTARAPEMTWHTTVIVPLRPTKNYNLYIYIYICFRSVPN